jgi:hypothetical protein
MFNLLQQQSSSTSSSASNGGAICTAPINTSLQTSSQSQLTASNSMKKLPSFLTNHHHNLNHSNSYNFNVYNQFNAKPYNHHHQQQQQIFTNGQQQHQYQFQKSYSNILPIASPLHNSHQSTWPGSHQNEAPLVLSPPNKQKFVLNIENSDDHFNRHIENLNKNDDENTSLICEEQEELNEAKLSQLIMLNKNKKKSCGSTTDVDTECVEVANVVSAAAAALVASSSSVVADTSLNKEENNDEDYFCMVNNDEQPKVFQDEEVDLHAVSQLNLTSNEHKSLGDCHQKSLIKSDGLSVSTAMGSTIGKI